MNEYRELAAWVIERWDEGVKHRPMGNIHRRTLDDTWREVYAKLTVSGGTPVI